MADEPLPQKKTIHALAFGLAFVEGALWTRLGTLPLYDPLSGVFAFILVYAWLYYDCIDYAQRISKVELIFLLYPMMLPLVLLLHLARTRRGRIWLALLELAGYGVLMLLVGALGYLVAAIPSVFRG